MRTAEGSRSVAGVSLVEVMLVLVVMGIGASMAMPRFATATEQTQVDQAGAALRSVWLAERLWWLEQHEFCSSLPALVDGHCLDGPLAAQTKPFTLDLISADDSSFVARMTRTGSGNWSGELLIDETGAVTGFITNEAGLHVLPQGS